MAQVLERLTAPKAPIDMGRSHKAEEFHGKSLEESERVEFWLEMLQRVLDETVYGFGFWVLGFGL